MATTAPSRHRASESLRRRGINAAVGWSWAGPAVALVVAGFATYAGINAWREAGEQTRCDETPSGVLGRLRPQRQQDEQRGPDR